MHIRNTFFLITLLQFVYFISSYAISVFFLTFKITYAKIEIFIIIYYSTLPLPKIITSYIRDVINTLLKYLTSYNVWVYT